MDGHRVGSFSTTASLTLLLTLFVCLSSVTNRKNRLFLIDVGAGVGKLCFFSWFVVLLKKNKKRGKNSDSLGFGFF